MRHGIGRARFLFVKRGTPPIIVGGVRGVRYFPTACFAALSSEPNAAESETASSANALRLTVIPDFFRPFMKTEYVRPSLRTAALMRLIHKARKSRLRTRRSRYAYASECSRASFATR